MQYLKLHEIDLVFLQCKDVEQGITKQGGKFSPAASLKKRKLKFSEFKTAIGLLAAKLGMAKKEIEEYIVQATKRGPSNNGGTIAESNKFYDDTSLYTGVHKKGGPVTAERNKIGLHEQLSRNFKESKTLRAQKGGGGGSKNDLLNEGLTHTELGSSTGSNRERRGFGEDRGIAEREYYIRSPGGPGTEFSVTVTPVMAKTDTTPTKETPAADVIVREEEVSPDAYSTMSSSKKKSIQLVPRPIANSIGGLHDIFIMYCATHCQSTSAHHEIGAKAHETVTIASPNTKRDIVPLLSSLRFAKLCKDANLMEDKGPPYVSGLKYEDLDIIFLQAKAEHSTIKYQGYGRVGNAAAKKLDWNAFKSAVTIIAARLGLEKKELEQYLGKVLESGPKNNNGTVATPHRFHDDPHAYTGVHKFGGPNTYEMERQDLSIFLSRDYKRDKTLRKQKGLTIIPEHQKTVLKATTDEALLHKVRSAILSRQLPNDSSVSLLEEAEEKFESVFDIPTQGSNYSYNSGDGNGFSSNHSVHSHHSLPMLSTKKSPIASGRFNGGRAATIASPAGGGDLDGPVPWGMTAESAQARRQQRLHDEQRAITELTEQMGTADLDPTESSMLPLPAPVENPRGKSGSITMPIAPTMVPGTTPSSSIATTTNTTTNKANKEELGVKDKLIHIFSSECGSAGGTIDATGFVELCKKCGIIPTRSDRDGPGLKVSDMMNLFMKCKNSSMYGARVMALEDFLIATIPALASLMKSPVDLLAMFMHQNYLTYVDEGQDAA